jgi:hypothetical protein
MTNIKKKLTYSDQNKRRKKREPENLLKYMSTWCLPEVYNIRTNRPCQMVNMPKSRITAQNNERLLATKVFILEFNCVVETSILQNGILILMKHTSSKF